MSTIRDLFSLEFYGKLFLFFLDKSPFEMYL